jgi:predicted metal-dependent hydrolase
MPPKPFETLTHLQFGDVNIQVVRKNVKNINLRVAAPDGAVTVSAPLGMKPERIQRFVESKLNWITTQQQKIRERPRATPKTFENQEQHHLWGEAYTLQVIEKAAPVQFKLQKEQIILQLRPGSSPTQKQQMLDAIYEQQMQKALTPLLAKWQLRMGVRAAGVTIRKMKTRWGSCSIRARTIRLNLELAKKPPECLEYVLVHELAHLLVPSHDARFVAVMDQFLPQWRLIRTQLNDAHL